MRKITPELTKEILKQTTPETVAKDDAIEVLNYKELRKHIAQLSYANKDCILFYRGQKDDYRNHLFALDKTIYNLYLRKTTVQYVYEALYNLKLL